MQPQLSSYQNILDAALRHCLSTNTGKVLGVNFQKSEDQNQPLYLLVLLDLLDPFYLEHVRSVRSVKAVLNN